MTRDWGRWRVLVVSIATRRGHGRPAVILGRAVVGRDHIHIFRMPSSRRGVLNVWRIVGSCRRRVMIRSIIERSRESVRHRIRPRSVLGRRVAIRARGLHMRRRCSSHRSRTNRMGSSEDVLVRSLHHRGLSMAIHYHFDAFIAIGWCRCLLSSSLGGLDRFSLFGCLYLCCHSCFRIRSAVKERSQTVSTENCILGSGL